MKRSVLITWMIPAVLLTGAAVGILVLWPREVKPPTLEEANLRPVPPVPLAPLAEVDRLDVRNRYGEFSLEKRADGWVMTRPFLARANQSLVKNLFERLGKLEFGLVVSRDPKSQEQEKVAGKLAVELRLHRGAQVIWHVFLGKSDDFTLFRASDSLEIWQIRGAVRQQFVRDAVGWIDPQLIAEPVAGLRGIRYLMPDQSQFAHFRLEKPATVTLAEGPEVLKNFHASRVTRSLSRLFSLRLHRVESDPAKIRAALASPFGGVELEFASGKRLRLTIGAGTDADSHVRIEEKAPGAANFQEYVYAAIVHTHMLREMLLLRPLDLEDPLLHSATAEAVFALRGQCEQFTYEIVRDERKKFVVKSSSQEFALANSSIEGFFRFLSDELLTAARVVDPQEVPVEFAVGPGSDFLELEQLVNGKKTVVRIAWGKMTPVDGAGIRYHHVTVSTRPDLVFQVMEKKIMPICRTKTTWQLSATDPEYLPTPGMFVR